MIHKVPSEYITLLVTSSKSREVEDAVGEAADAVKKPELREAAAAFLMIDHDRNALLSLDEFEQLMLGRAMAMGGDEVFSHSKLRRMFDKSDINKDGLVDFNEFVLMRSRAEGKKQQKAAASSSTTSPAKASGSSRQRSPHRGGGGGGKKKGSSAGGKGGGRARRPSGDDDVTEVIGEWVEAVRGVQKQSEDQYNRKVEAHERMVERRFAAGDALADLELDEVLVLETELLTEFPDALSAAACASCLNLLGLRLGKMFSPKDVDSLIGEVISGGAAARATATCTPAQLLAGLRARMRA